MKLNSAEKDKENLKEEHLIVKQMVVEKDKILNRLKESHEKEMASLKLEKKSSDEALSCVTRENISVSLHILKSASSKSFVDTKTTVIISTSVTVTSIF